MIFSTQKLGKEFRMIAFWGKYISVLHRQEQKYVTGAMKEYGLGYSSYNFLLNISEWEGCSQKQLCRHMAMDEALATRTIRSLVEQGYVVRKQEDFDRRSYSLYMTDQGKALIPLIRSTLIQWWSDITCDFNEEERTLLMAQLKQMSEKTLRNTTEETT